jgi:manganese transport protein
MITNKKELMGPLKNKTFTNIMGWLISSVIIAANAVLLFLTFRGKV